jgi:hypothetical protein
MAEELTYEPFDDEWSGTNSDITDFDQTNFFLRGLVPPNQWNREPIEAIRVQHANRGSVYVGELKNGKGGTIQVYRDEGTRLTIQWNRETNLITSQDGGFGETHPARRVDNLNLPTLDSDDLERIDRAYSTPDLESARNRKRHVYSRYRIEIR